MKHFQKVHQLIYFLRQLKKFGVNKIDITRFYRAVVESVLTFFNHCLVRQCSPAGQKQIELSTAGYALSNVSPTAGYALSNVSCCIWTAAHRLFLWWLALCVCMCIGACVCVC